MDYYQYDDYDAYNEYEGYGQTTFEYETGEPLKENSVKNIQSPKQEQLLNNSQSFHFPASMVDPVSPRSNFSQIDDLQNDPTLSNLTSPYSYVSNNTTAYISFNVDVLETANALEASQAAKNVKKSYSVCGPQEIDNDRASVENDVIELTGLHHDTVSMLLRLNKFNKEKVVESLVEQKSEFLKSNRVDLWESFFTTNSIHINDILGDLSSFQSNPYIQAIASPEKISHVECAVCFDKPPLNHAVNSPCGHTFCLDCYIGYIQSHITTFKKATRMCCMEPSCKQYLPDTLIKSIIFASLLLDSNPNDISADAFEDVSTFNNKQSITNMTISTNNGVISGDLFSPSTNDQHINAASSTTNSQIDRSLSLSSNSQANAQDKPRFAKFARDEQKYNNTPSSSPRVNSTTPTTISQDELILPDNTVESITLVIPVEKLWSKYCSLLRKAYSDDKRTLKYCPNPNCNMVIKGTASTVAAECSCGTTMCFRCDYEEDHAPVSCESLVTWLDRCSKDSETAQWIMFNTRKCPKCYTRIEKNAGCNHMTCTNCNHEFCWVCDGAWSDHLKDAKNVASAYRCNRFDIKKNISNEQVEDKKIIEERDSQRYFFYFSRYHAMSSMK